MMEFVFGAFSMAAFVFSITALARVSSLEKKLKESGEQQS